MFNVTGNKNEIVWDAEKNAPLIRFRDGKAQTEDQAVADKLAALGYAVKKAGTKAATGGGA